MARLSILKRVLIGEVVWVLQSRFLFIDLS